MKRKSALIGTMMVSGSAIGVGMFSLPVVSSGMWFLLAALSLVIIWWVTYLSTLMILEVNLCYPAGTSFSTFVKDILGEFWAGIMGISVFFILYILLYAYYSAFGNMATHILGLSSDSLVGGRGVQGSLGFFMGMILAVAVWISTRSVGRLSTVLVVAMALSYLIGMVGAGSEINVSALFQGPPQGTTYTAYIWAGLPYFLTSFGISSIVPSLYKYYGPDISKIRNSLFFGSLIALITYLIWILISFGIIPRSEFSEIRMAGGNVGHLVAALEQRIGDGNIRLSIQYFSNLAVISSFLGVGISLFDYIADRFNFSENKTGRLFAALLTFVPPGLASFLFPNGFISAIGFAGLFLFIGFFLIPFLMILKVRRQEKKASYRLFGGYPVIWMVLILSLTTAICHILSMLNFLPKL